MSDLQGIETTPKPAPDGAVFMLAIGVTIGVIMAAAGAWSEIPKHPITWIGTATITASMWIGAFSAERTKKQLFAVALLVLGAAMIFFGQN